MRFSTSIMTFVFFCLTACVSVSLSQRDVKRAAGVQYSVPETPMVQESSMKDVDAAWKNPKNGNLISYLTDCHDESDPALDFIVQGALGGLTDLKYDRKDSPMIQGREARRVVASGRVDGVPSKIDLLAFKRDNCIFILSYVGVQKSFAENHSQFERFIEGFRAP